MIDQNGQRRRLPRPPVEVAQVPDRFETAFNIATARGATSFNFDPVNRCMVLEIPDAVATVYLPELLLDHGP